MTTKRNEEDDDGGDDDDDDDDDDEDDDKPLSRTGKVKSQTAKDHVHHRLRREKGGDVLVPKGPRFPDPLPAAPQGRQAQVRRQARGPAARDRGGCHVLRRQDRDPARPKSNLQPQLLRRLHRRPQRVPAKRRHPDQVVRQARLPRHTASNSASATSTSNHPGLFLGRGAHPKAGKVKRRIYPGDITINHSAEHPAPSPPPGLGDWGEVVEKKDVHPGSPTGRKTSTASTSTSSSTPPPTSRTNSDREKFEKARKLDTVVKQIRRDVNKNLKSNVRNERQIATIVWLIDNFSLRAGNEKGEDEAETYGVCSLRCEHAQVKMPDTIHLEFLGKDSMKFEEDLKITNPDVFKNITMFLKTNGMKDKSGNYVRKKPNDPIFCAARRLGRRQDAAAAAQRRQHLPVQVHEGASAPRSRPNKAEREINQTNLRLAYNEANRQVAILCNHQKTVNPMLLNRNLERTQEKIFQIRYEIMKEQQKILTFHKIGELKKEFKAKEFPFMKQFDLIMQRQELDADKVKEYEERLISDKKAKLESTFKRQQSEVQYQLEQKGVASEDGTKKKGKKAKDVEEEVRSSIKGFKDKKQVDDELKALSETAKRLEKERKTNKSQAASCNFASSAKKILSKHDMIRKQEAELVNKNNTSDVALSTSKLNYIDPRITLAWLKEWGRPARRHGPGQECSRQEEGGQEGGGGGGRQAGPEGWQEGSCCCSSCRCQEGQDGHGNSTGDSEKMELGLQVMNISQFFAASLQKKFKWAASGDDGRDISARWVFVKDAQGKMRKLDSAERKGQDGGSMVAMTDAAETSEGEAARGQRHAQAADGGGQEAERAAQGGRQGRGERERQQHEQRQRERRRQAARRVVRRSLCQGCSRALETRSRGSKSGGSAAGGKVSRASCGCGY
ncbi:hypothetical protein L1887_55051 [Cichorium endivia]|nr:hypothetical protein L1887_55051 [Cichorium endivia]